MCARVLRRAGGGARGVQGERGAAESIPEGRPLPGQTDPPSFSILDIVSMNPCRDVNGGDDDAEDGDAGGVSGVRVDSLIRGGGDDDGFWRVQ
eukprot:2374487-Rhodomonas_salina.3